MTIVVGVGGTDCVVSVDIQETMLIRNRNIVILGYYFNLTPDLNNISF